MNKKYTKELINTIVSQHHKGKSVALLCAEHEIPRSTIYFWLKQNKKLKSSDNAEISHREYYDLKRRTEKLEERLKVIKASGCSLSAPLKEKLEALEKLHGQYTVHALCDALEVSRGTFYNYIFRRNKVTRHDIHREEVREQVRLVFDESKQRFGSKKIHAVLLERGTRTSVGYIADLMREMDLQSIGRHSKKEHKKKTGMVKRENKLKRQFNVLEPNKVWVSDTTCFKVRGRYYYTQPSPDTLHQVCYTNFCIIKSYTHQLLNRARGGDKMHKRCNPSPRVRRAGRTLSTSNSPSAKSEVAKKLANHRWSNHR